MIVMEDLFKIVKHSKYPIIGEWKYKSWYSYMIEDHKVTKSYTIEEYLITWKMFALGENKTWIMSTIPFYEGV